MPLSPSGQIVSPSSILMQVTQGSLAPAPPGIRDRPPWPAAWVKIKEMFLKSPIYLFKYLIMSALLVPPSWRVTRPSGAVEKSVRQQSRCQILHPEFYIQHQPDLQESKIVSKHYIYTIIHIMIIKLHFLGKGKCFIEKLFIFYLYLMRSIRHQTSSRCYSC